jgi:hypothetical protein
VLKGVIRNLFKENKMSSEANVSADLITIDGENYSQSDLSDEQLYFIRQIQSCNLKINSLKFDLEQVQASAMVFNQRLSKSVEKIKPKKMG